MRKHNNVFLWSVNNKKKNCVLLKERVLCIFDYIISTALRHVLITPPGRTHIKH